jgi:hypothetical protein
MSRKISDLSLTTTNYVATVVETDSVNHYITGTATVNVSVTE